MDLAYDNETKILEYININLWELFLVISASDACYFMLIMNSTLVFQYIEFLKKKNYKWNSWYFEEVYDRSRETN